MAFTEVQPLNNFKHPVVRIASDNKDRLEEIMDKHASLGYSVKDSVDHFDGVFEVYMEKK